MKTSKVFAIAKRHVATKFEGKGEGEKFICYALARARGNRLISVDDMDNAVGIIANRLGNCRTLEQWLMSYHNIQMAGWCDAGVQEKMHTEYRDKMQATRHAWLDSLITEFQSKGD